MAALAESEQAAATDSVLDEVGETKASYQRARGTACEPPLTACGVASSAALPPNPPPPTAQKPRPTPQFPVRTGCRRSHTACWLQQQQPPPKRAHTTRDFRIRWLRVSAWISLPTAHRPTRLRGPRIRPKRC